MILKLFCEYIAIYFQFTSHIWKGLVYQNTTIKKKEEKETYEHKICVCWLFFSCLMLAMFLNFLLSYAFFLALLSCRGDPCGWFLRDFWQISVWFLVKWARFSFKKRHVAYSTTKNRNSNHFPRKNIKKRDIEDFRRDILQKRGAVQLKTSQMATAYDLIGF
jgi:hypothetical protein